MLDVIIRGIRHPLDYIRALQEHTLVLKTKIDEGNGVYSFIFESAKPVHWKAGQHGIFRIPDKKITGKRWRAFSIASASSECEIRITTVISDTPSSFKNALQALTFGSSVVMNGPFGEFFVRDKKAIVGIASGVGITPFRAIIQEIAHGNLPDVHLHLLYSSKNETPTFKNELESLKNNSQIIIDYFNSQDDAVESMITIAKLRKNSAAYYISGSPRFIDRVRMMLKKCGIYNIINDPFKGY